MRYFADRGDTPGRWLGQGARGLGLAGEVDFSDFSSVLAGRDPRTGARLITARGSADRVASLGTGTIARWGPSGDALYSVRDAARMLGWSQADLREAIAKGERLAASRLLVTLTGTGTPDGTRAAAMTGNGTGSDPGRNGNTGTRPPGPGRAPATDPSNGTATTASGRTPGRSTDGAGTAIPAGTLAAATTGNPTGSDAGPDRDESTRTPGPERERGGGRDGVEYEEDERPAPDPDTGTGTGNALAGPAQAATANEVAGSGRAEPGRHAGADRDDPVMTLVPFIDRDGTRHVNEAELSRVEDLASRGLPRKEHTAPRPDPHLTLTPCLTWDDGRSLVGSGQLQVKIGRRCEAVGVPSRSTVLVRHGGRRPGHDGGDGGRVECGVGQGGTSDAVRGRVGRWRSEWFAARFRMMESTKLRQKRRIPPFCRSCGAASALRPGPAAPVRAQGW